METLTGSHTAAPRRRTAGRAAGVALLAALLALFFIDIERYRHIAPPELHAFGHFLFFFILTLLLWHARLPGRLHPQRRAVALVLLALGTGILIEAAQTLVGRTAGLRDLWQNVLGAATAALACLPATSRRNLLAGGLAIALVVEFQGPTISLLDRGIARAQFPVLSHFDTPFAHRRWTMGTPDTGISFDGGRSLRLDLEPGRYAGTTLKRSLGDWTGYQTLLIRLYNPGTDALPLTISIRDHEHFRRGGDYRDRFNRRAALQPGWNTLTIAVEDIRQAPAERRLDLTDLSELVLFTTDLGAPRSLHLDRVELLP